MYSGNVAQLQDQKVLRKLPVVSGYKILIAMPEVKEKTAGGVILPTNVKHQEQTASILGYVVRVGADAYADKTRYPNGPWCKVGDWVVFRSYSGTRFRYGEQEYRIINDDTVDGVVPDPTGYERV
jgi:co-chaperonin GroES (HSP10)